jgi:hypothetical protein
VTPEEAVIEFAWHLSASDDGALVVSGEEVDRWPALFAVAVREANLLTELPPASTVRCRACEAGHLEDVEVVDDDRGIVHWVIRCPTYGRVEITDHERLQWRVEPDNVAAFVRAEFDLVGRVVAEVGQRLWRLGTNAAGATMFLTRGADWGDGDFVRARLAESATDDALVVDGGRPFMVWRDGTLAVDRGRIASTVPPEQWTRREEAEVVPAYIFRPSGRVWQLSFGGSPFFAVDSKGMSVIRSLLVQPNRWVAIIDMVPLAECGLEMVDTETLKAVRRLAANGDASANQLKTFIRSVARRDGTSKRTGGSATRASNAVRMNITRAVAGIRKDNREMAEHLDRCVKTGLALSYQCDQPFEWVC